MVKEIQATKDQVNANKLIVTREPFTTKDGRHLDGYVVKGKAFGRDIKAHFNAADVGGYDMLNLLFDISTQPELVVREDSMTDPATGEIRNYSVYEVQAVDQDGEVYS